MNRRSRMHNALGLVLGLMFLLWARMPRLLLKVEYSTAQGHLAQFMEEYSDLGGILTPTRVVTTTRGQRVSVTRLASVEANVEIPEERFDLPEAVRKALPCSRSKT